MRNQALRGLVLQGCRHCEPCCVMLSGICFVLLGGRAGRVAVRINRKTSYDPIYTDLFKKCVIFGGTRTNGHYDIKEGVPQSPKKLIKKKSVGEFERKWLSKIFKLSKNDLSSELFFSDFFHGTPLIFFQNLKTLETSFSKLVLHAQKVHILRD